MYIWLACVVIIGNIPCNHGQYPESQGPGSSHRQVTRKLNDTDRVNFLWYLNVLHLSVLMNDIYYKYKVIYFPSIISKIIYFLDFRDGNIKPNGFRDDLRSHIPRRSIAVQEKYFDYTI